MGVVTSIDTWQLGVGVGVGVVTSIDAWRLGLVCGQKMPLPGTRPLDPGGGLKL